MTNDDPVVGRAKMLRVELDAAIGRITELEKAARVLLARMGPTEDAAEADAAVALLALVGIDTVAAIAIAEAAGSHDPQP